MIRFWGVLIIPTLFSLVMNDFYKFSAQDIKCGKESNGNWQNRFIQICVRYKKLQIFADKFSSGNATHQDKEEEL